MFSLEVITLLFKIIVTVLALFGAQKVFNDIIIKNNKRFSDNIFHGGSNKLLNAHKIVINTYNFPGVGNSSDFLRPKVEGEIDNTESNNPVKLTNEQEELCERLDFWHKKYGLSTKPSDMFRGALYASRQPLNQNPDWIAQAAHSLRDILYPFGNNGTPNKTQALKDYGSVFSNNQSFVDEFGRIYGTLTELAHHGNGRGNSVDFLSFKPSDFDKIIVDFERIMKDGLLRQLDVHKEIDTILTSVTTKPSKK